MVSGVQMVIDPLAQFGRASHPGYHFAWGARFVEYQGRDAADAKGTGQGRLFVHVHFDDVKTTLILLGQFAEERGQLTARPAPGSPKIDGHRQNGSHHHGGEFARGDIGDKGGGETHGK